MAEVVLCGGVWWCMGMTPQTTPRTSGRLQKQRRGSPGKIKSEMLMVKISIRITTS